MTTINVDIDALRDYLMNHTSTAAFSGFPAAILNVADIQSMSPRELCEKAEDMAAPFASGRSRP